MIVSASRTKEVPHMLTTLYTLLFMIVLGGAACATR